MASLKNVVLAVFRNDSSTFCPFIFASSAGSDQIAITVLVVIVVVLPQFSDIISF